MKVSISLERYLSFKIKLWKEKYFKTKKAHIFAALVCFIIYAINSNVLFKFGYEFNGNGTDVVQCFTTIPSTQWMAIWNFVSYLNFCLFF